MKNHVFRPLLVIIGIVALILLVRMIYVPKDFGIGPAGYMYGWHRGGNEAEWKTFKIKYQGKESCKDCHDKNYRTITGSPHKIIQCENCHGPSIDHPAEPTKLVIDKSRAQCLRCHFPLPYPSSGRAAIKSIDPDTHNPGIECSTCHNPHKPMEGLR